MHRTESLGTGGGRLRGGWVGSWESGPVLQCRSMSAHRVLRIAALANGALRLSNLLQEESHGTRQLENFILVFFPHYLTD